MLFAHEFLLVLVHLVLHHLQLYLLVVLVLLHQVVLPREREGFSAGMVAARDSLRRLIELWVTGFLLRFVQVASVFLPDVRHLAQGRIIEERVLWALLLRHTLTRVLQLLALAAVSDDLLFLAIEGVGEDARLK